MPKRLLLTAVSRRALAVAWLGCLLLVFALASPGALAQDPTTPPPVDADDLAQAEALQQHLEDLCARVAPMYVRVAGGSGVVISADGYFLTNYHVVQSEPRYEVRLGNGETYWATNIGQDPVGDICLLKIDTDHPLEYMPLGDSDALRPGQTVLAMGNPWSYARVDAFPTFTFGAVTAIHRFQATYFDAIMHDCRVNPGNSGGPLFDLDGNLLGINGRIAVRQTFLTRVSTGIGYAIPINQIVRFVRMWRRHGGLLFHAQVAGLDIQTVHTSGQGALVQRVATGSEADRAGLRQGDMIVAVDDMEVFNRNRFYSVIGTYPEGYQVTLTVLRAGERQELTVVLDPVIPEQLPGTVVERRFPWPEQDPPPVGPGGVVPPVVGPVEPPATRVPGWLGVGADRAYDVYVRGCPIQRLNADSPAARAGLRRGDVIVAIEGQPVQTLADVASILSSTRPGQTVRIRILREGVPQVLNVRLAARPA